MKSIARTKLFIYNSDLMCQHIIISLVPASSFTAYVASQYFVFVFFFCIYFFLFCSYLCHLKVMLKTKNQISSPFRVTNKFYSILCSPDGPLLVVNWAIWRLVNHDESCGHGHFANRLMTIFGATFPYWKYILHFLRTRSDVAQPLFKHPIWSCINFIL